MATEANDTTTLPPADSLPQYHEMIMEAIDAQGDKNGITRAAISRYMESTFGELPAAHSSLLTHHLNKMKEAGELVFYKNNYLKPTPDAPPRRGRGRPPKPKVELTPGHVSPPSRPRGRPPKPRDSFDLPPAKKPKTHTSTGRPRGRPPKKDKEAGAEAPSKEDAEVTEAEEAPAVTVAPVTGSPRPRGRPPKVKPTVAAVGC